MVAVALEGSLVMAQKVRPLWWRLEPWQQVIVLAAFTGLLILLAAGLLLIRVGAHVTRRYMHRSESKSIYDPDAWARKPLVAADLLERADRDDGPADQDPNSDEPGSR